MFGITRHRRKTLKKRKKNGNEKKSNNNNNDNKYFFYSYFFILKNLYFVRRHIWKNLVCIVTYVSKVFLPGRLLQVQ